MKLVIWFARNPIAANLLMLLIIAGGALGLYQAKRYTFPPEPQNLLQITAAYPSAGPSEVERALCIPIEEAIQELEGIKSIQSVAQQAQCEITVEIDASRDTAHFQAQIKARIDSIKTLPKEIEKLNIQELKTGTPAVIVVIRGTADMLTLQHQRDQLKSLLSRHPDIGAMTAWPQYTHEIAIEITEAKLRQYGLSFDEVAASINSTSRTIPAGEIKKRDGKLLLRSVGQAMTVADFSAIELRPAHDGRHVRLGDIARIHETIHEQDLKVRVDGIPATEIFVMPKHQINTTVAAVHQVIETFRPGLPDGVEIATWDDWSKYYDRYMSMLIEDALSGFLLVFIVLLFTMRFHLALWVSCGIVISLFGALWMMPILDISLNTYSIAALILVLGVLADDAIIVGENIYTYQQRGHSAISAAIDGTLEVMPLVIMMVLSAMIAFVPGLFLPGLSGQLMFNISMVIILTLIFSMMEALLILPSHLAVEHQTPAPSQNRAARIIGYMQDQVESGMHWLINRVYVPLLVTALRFRYITLTLFCIALVLFAALAQSGRIPSVIDPEVSEYYLLAQIEYPPGTPFETVDFQVRRLEDIARQMQAELDDELGLQRTSDGTASSFQHIITILDENQGMVDIEIAIDERVRSHMTEIKKQWQERFGEVPAGATLSFQTFWPRNLGMPSSQSGKAIELQLIAADPAVQTTAGEILKNRLAAYVGVHSVTGSMQIGKPELHLKLKPEAKFHGLTLQSLGEQVRSAFFGLEVQRFFKNKEEVRVMLRLPATNRRSLDNLDYMPILLPNGSFVPFMTVAEVDHTPGFASITRHNRERIQLISAEVYKGEASVENLLTDLHTTVIPELEARFPGLRIEPGQNRQKQEQAMSVLWGYGTLAALAIYALLAIPLRSYTQPILIMLAIPFGFIGAVLGHLLLNIPLSLESYVALFAVGGIVINDSLILVARINATLDRNAPLFHAIILSGKARFRAIFLTTVTTCVGLLPLMSEQSPHAQKMLPMATTLAFGVLFATLITLLLIPVACAILKEVAYWQSSR